MTLMFLLFTLRTFNRSRFHGTPALSAIDSYFEIEAMVNRSMDLVQQANVTLNNITEKVSDHYCFLLNISRCTRNLRCSKIPWQWFFSQAGRFFGYMLVTREANVMDHSKRLFFLYLLQKRNSKANKQIYKNGTSVLHFRWGGERMGDTLSQKPICFIIELYLLRVDTNPSACDRNS